MADQAHEWTDEQIEALRRRFRRTYSQAEAEMRAKLDKLMSDFDLANAKWQERLRAGTVTQEDYEAWLKRMSTDRSFVGGIADSFANDAADTNRLVADYINDTVPMIYAENANMAAFEVESGIGYDTHGFDLYDQSTVRRLIAEDNALVREVKPDRAKDVAWNRQKFNGAITQSILQGESIPNTAKRLRTVLKMDENAAVRAARTAITCAENAGRTDSYKRAKRLGIELEQEWMATLDQRTRHSHRELDGQHVPVGEKFKVDGIELEYPGDPSAPGEYVWNCFIGDTLSVPLGGIERSFGRFYEGDAVTVRTSRGVEFTCTPNHPILTTQGWVPAGFLDDGYDLIVAGIGNGVVLRDNPDIEHVGTRMDAIHELCSELASQGAARLDVNFHEDVLARDVDVITQERPLRVNAKTFELEPVNKLRLELPDALAPSDGAKVKFLSASMTASDGLVSGSGESGPLRWASVSHALEHRLRTVAGNDSHAFEPAGYGTSTDAEVLRESLDGLSAVIEFDHVIDVDVHPVSCHVYNLQTESGAYLVTNNDSVPLFAISHNCRCTLVAWFPDIEQEDPDRWSRLPDNMTYDDWKAGKEAEEKAKK